MIKRSKGNSLCVSFMQHEEMKFPSENKIMNLSSKKKKFNINKVYLMTSFKSHEINEICDHNIVVCCLSCKCLAAPLL